MTDIVAKLRPVREMLRSMPDEDRVKFISSKFIAIWEKDGNFEPGTLPLDEQEYWIENAERLVYLDNGNRDPDILLYDAYQTLKPYLYVSEREDQNSMFSIFTDISTLLLEVSARSVGTVAQTASLVGADTYEGTKVVLTNVGEKTKEKIVETVEALVGRYENVAYLTIAAGLVGTTVLYFKS